MPLIVPAELKTHMYPEVQQVITRSDSTIAETAINTAIKTAKMFLHKYDLLQLFGNEETEPTVADEMLKGIVKSIAVWELIRLANPNVDMTVVRTNYEDAMGLLKNIQRGAACPEGWPYKDTTDQTAPNGDSIEWSSNPPVTLHF